LCARVWATREQMHTYCVFEISGGVKWCQSVYVVFKRSFHFYFLSFSFLLSDFNCCAFVLVNISISTHFLFPFYHLAPLRRPPHHHSWWRLGWPSSWPSRSSFPSFWPVPWPQAASPFGATPSRECALFSFFLNRKYIHVQLLLVWIRKKQKKFCNDIYISAYYFTRPTLLVKRSSRFFLLSSRMEAFLLIWELSLKGSYRPPSHLNYFSDWLLCFSLAFCCRCCFPILAATGRCSWFRSSTCTRKGWKPFPRRKSRSKKRRVLRNISWSIARRKRLHQTQTRK